MGIRLIASEENQPNWNGLLTLSSSKLVECQFVVPKLPFSRPFSPHCKRTRKRMQVAFFVKDREVIGIVIRTQFYELRNQSRLTLKAVRRHDDPFPIPGNCTRVQEHSIGSVFGRIAGREAAKNARH